VIYVYAGVHYAYAHLRIKNNILLKTLSLRPLQLGGQRQRRAFACLRRRRALLLSRHRINYLVAPELIGFPDIWGVYCLNIILLRVERIVRSGARCIQLHWCIALAEEESCVAGIYYGI
jgi:hypothetical protein